MVRSYLRQRRGVLLTFLLFGGLFAVTFALYSLPVQAVAYPFLLCVVAGSILLAADYRQALRRHRQMERVLRLPDEIAASLPPADTVEREDYRQLVALLEESRRQIQSQAQRRYGDMVDYYTLWAHQIKTPIASMRLTLQNEDSDLARSLSGDLMRVEQYVEMVLVFLRLDSSTTDYVIRRHSLDDIVRPAVRRFAGEFIRRRLRLEYQPLDHTVVTDGKWLGFVVEQVLSNALKYTASGSVTIAMDGDDLCIRDTGMGIAAEDLPRIFEQGFTGVNGRRDRRPAASGCTFAAGSAETWDTPSGPAPFPTRERKFASVLGKRKRCRSKNQIQLQTKTRHPGQGVVFFYLSTFLYTKQLKIYTKLTLKDCPLCHLAR